MKTRHSRQETDVHEVLVIEDSDRDSSPLTELCSDSPLIPPLADAPPPPGIPETSVANPRASPTTSLHQSNIPPTPISEQAGNSASSRNQTQGPEANPRLEPDTPHIVFEPLPALGPESAPATTGSHADGAKPSVSTDKKPKLKGKKKAVPESQFTMDDTLLDKRLLAVGPDFEVDNDRITHQHVGPNSRATMSRIFGGNPQRMISYPSPEKRRAHGFASALLFPSRNFNPLLPTKIGERGLLFRLDQKLSKWVDNEGGVGPYHLMMHHASDDYFYFGLYEFVRVDPVTKDEWLVQSSQVCCRFRLYTVSLIVWVGQGQLGEPCD
jgi:hypothetical protein